MAHLARALFALSLFPALAHGDALLAHAAFAKPAKPAKPLKLPPVLLACDSKLPFAVKKKAYKPGLQKLTLSETPEIVFSTDEKGEKPVAKLYPQGGLDGTLLDKTMAMRTDERTFWEVVNEKKKSIVYCEIKD